MTTTGAAVKSVPTILVTGFLGSGKTTFLNVLGQRLHQAGLRVAVLVNEVGDTALDALLVQSDHVVEVTHGSIFCACVRGDLVSAMRNIVEKVRPDVLVVEATGVADPGELGGFSDDPDVTALYRLAYSVCLASANRLYKVAQTLAAVRRQLAVANMVVVTGSDVASPEDMERTFAAIEKYGKRAAVAVAPFARLPEPIWQTIIEKTAGTGQHGVSVPEPTENEPLERARDVYGTRLIQAEHMPSAAAINALVARLPVGTERAKGFVRVGDEIKVFQYRGGIASLDAAPEGSEAPGWVLAIGRYPKLVSFGISPKKPI